MDKEDKERGKGGECGVGFGTRRVGKRGMKVAWKEG